MCIRDRSSDFRLDRVRQFQQWYRNGAQPHEKRCHNSGGLLRSMRLPVSALPSSYLAALRVYWWLDDCGRDAVGWLLAEPKPSWQDVRRLLTIAAGTVAPAAKGPRRRRGPGVALAACKPNRRALTTLQRWHARPRDGSRAPPNPRCRPAARQPLLRMSAASGRAWRRTSSARGSRTASWSLAWALSAPVHGALSPGSRAAGAPCRRWAFGRHRTPQRRPSPARVWRGLRKWSHTIGWIRSTPCAFGGVLALAAPTR